MDAYEPVGAIMLIVRKATLFSDYTVYVARYDNAVGKGESYHAAIADWIENSSYTVNNCVVEWVDFDGETHCERFDDYAAAARKFDGFHDAVESAEIVGYSDKTMWAECVVLAYKGK